MKQEDGWIHSGTLERMEFPRPKGLFKPSTVSRTMRLLEGEGRVEKRYENNSVLYKYSPSKSIASQCCPSYFIIPTDCDVLDCEPTHKLPLESIQRCPVLLKMELALVNTSTVLSDLFIMTNPPEVVSQ